MIVAKNLVKKFSGQIAINGISFSIKPGEIIGLLGPNGAGKTTTIRMLAGVLPPTSGQLEIDNQSFLQHEVSLKSQIGYLPENNPLYDDLTVEEHLHFYANLKGLSQSEAVEAINFAVAKTGISEVYYRPIAELSKGYRQRVGLAQAILKKPNILLLDEPTEGLDPNQRKDIQSLLTELKQDRTVIVSSHVLSEIQKLANRIIIIHQGKVVADGSPEKLLNTKSDVVELIVEIEGKGVMTALKKIKGIIDVEKLESNQYKLSCQDDRQVRKLVFQLVETNQWSLLTIKKVEQQLEDVFATLTGR